MGFQKNNKYRYWENEQPEQLGDWRGINIH